MCADTNKTEKSKEKAPKKTAPVTKSVSQSAGAAARNALQKRRVVTGVVVSDKMSKTIVVKVDRRVRETLYKKYVMKSRRFKAHDEKNSAKVGDLVTLVESRPLSRDKRWVLQNIVRRAGLVPDAGV